MLLSLIVFVLVAVAVSAIVDLAARRTREAARASAEAEALSTLAGHVLRGEAALPSLLARLRETFGLASVTLLERIQAPGPDDQGDPQAWRILATAGGAPCTNPSAADTDVVIDQHLTLAVRGRLLDAADRRVLEAFAAEAAVARELGSVARTDLQHGPGQSRQQPFALRRRPGLIPMTGADRPGMLRRTGPGRSRPRRSSLSRRLPVPRGVRSGGCAPSGRERSRG